MQESGILAVTDKRWREVVVMKERGGEEVSRGVL